MEGLRTVRVLVVDDKINEAVPFMEALAKRSIGTIYFSGTDLEKLPPEDAKLTGIRLAALDLDLEVGGEAQQAIGTLFNVMNRLLHENNGPYLAIAWTSKENEYFVEFQNRQTELACPPIDVIRMEKQVYADDIDSLFATVANSVEQAYPLGLLSCWEQIIHESSGSVMQIMPPSVGWIEQSRQTLRLILQSAAIPNDTAVAKLGALLSTFNSLQLDSIESDIASLEEEKTSPLTSPLDDCELSSDLDLKAKINRRLLCTELGTGIAPGNIYHCGQICFPDTVQFPTLNELLDDAVRSRPRSDLKERENQLKREELKIEQLKNAGCIPIAMEVTALCDYQQDNVKLPRFVCGLALPYDESKLAKKPSGFLRGDNAPIDFETGPLAGRKLLIWNSRYLVSAPKSCVNSDSALIRLRQAPLIDVQAWLASQLNRPGYLSLGDG